MKNLYSSPDVVQAIKRQGWVDGEKWGVVWENRNVYRVLMGKHETTSKI